MPGAAEDVYVQLLDGPVILSEAFGKSLRTAWINYAVGIVECKGIQAVFTNLYAGYGLGAQGSVLVSNGILAVPESIFLGALGTGCLEITSGLLSANNITLGLYNGGNGILRIADIGNMDISGLIRIGAGGSGIFEIVGSMNRIEIYNLDLAENSVIRVELDGSRGIGDGIIVTGNANIYGHIEPSFVEDTAVVGRYPLITIYDGIINDQTGGQLLSNDFVNQGWSYEIIGPMPNQLNLIYAGPGMDDCTAMATDMNEDCYTDIFDLKLFAEDWLECFLPWEIDCRRVR